MDIKVREVTMRIVDECNLTPEEWDASGINKGTAMWHLHMSANLNNRVKKQAPRLEAIPFYNEMMVYAKNIGFGSQEAIVAVTEQIYKVQLIFHEPKETTEEETV